MKLSNIINDHAREQSPYMEGLVNHLPMGQLALYKLTGDLKKVSSYTEFYNNRFTIDPVAKTYSRANSIEECLGKRENYEACLELMNQEVNTHGTKAMIKRILNDYPLGLSSGLFHVTIRLAYAQEASEVDEALGEEITRALAYYVTGYRKITPFYHRVPRKEIHQKINQLMKVAAVEKILCQNASLGQTMKQLYQSPEYLEAGFLIEGSEEDKIRGLLDLCLPAFEYTQSIVALHCITGLHGMLVLKDYFRDFTKALDNYTTAVITHLLTIDGIKFPKPDHEPILRSWTELMEEGADSKDVHTIKFTYTCHELFKRYSVEELKTALITQINK